MDRTYGHLARDSEAAILAQLEARNGVGGGVHDSGQRRRSASDEKADL
jgi:hypothetical protein